MSKAKLTYWLCPKCRQDLRASPHPGVKGKDCALCGQGINWRQEQLNRRAKEKGNG